MTDDRRQTRCGAALAAWALLTLWAAAASAHGTLPRGVQPFLDEEGALIGGMTSYGLIQTDGQGWTPEETLPLLIVWAHYAGDGVVIAGTPSGVFQTSDWGCSWERQAGLLERWDISDIQIDPTTPGRVLAAGRERGSGVTNAVFESLDNGLTWRETSLREIDGLVVRVVMSLDGAETWAQTEDREDQRWLHRSRDKGATWEAPIAIDPGWFGPVILGVGADNGALYLSDSVSALGIERRLRRYDIEEGAWEELGSFPGAEITDFADFAGRLLIVVANAESAQLYRTTAGGDFEEVPGGPTCLDPFIEPGVLWGCGSFGTMVNFFSSDDAEDFTRHDRFSSVCPSFCAAGTDGEALVPELWPLLNGEGVGGATCEVPEPPEEEDAGDGGEVGADAGVDAGSDAGAAETSGGGDGGGCAVAAGGVGGRAWLGWLLGVAFLWARRRG